MHKVASISLVVRKSRGLSLLFPSNLKPKPTSPRESCLLATAKSPPITTHQKPSKSHLQLHNRFIRLPITTSVNIDDRSRITKNPSKTQTWQNLAMAPSENDSHSTSNCYGEFVGRKANILASAYVVDNSASLTGFHYSTTGAGGAQWYP